MNSTEILNLVKNNEAHFQCAYDGNLWYKVEDFEFPVPFEDTKGGSFNATMKAIHLMRWIRKHGEVIAEQRTEPVEELVVG